MKPWKRIEPSTTTSSMESLQWGHGDEAVEEYAGLAQQCKAQLLQWGHGDEAVEENQVRQIPSRLSQCFNGATAMKPWKRAMPELSSVDIWTLQWGHGDEAVEEVADCRTYL